MDILNNIYVFSSYLIFDCIVFVFGYVWLCMGEVNACVFVEEDKIVISFKVRKNDYRKGCMVMRVLVHTYSSNLKSG